MKALTGASPDLPAGFLHFNSLPSVGYIDQKVVELLYDCSAATVWRRVNAGDLPAPRKFGRSTRWNVGEIRAHLAGPVTRVAA